MRQNQKKHETFVLLFSVLNGTTLMRCFLLMIRHKLRLHLDACGVQSRTDNRQFDRNDQNQKTPHPMRCFFADDKAQAALAP